MITLREFIEKAVADGKLGSTFTPREVKSAAAQACPEINQKHITSALNNQSEGPGDRKGAQVKRGTPAWLIKSEGGFSLKAVAPKTQSKIAGSVPTAKRSVTKSAGKIPMEPSAEAAQRKAARRIVDYLENMPFRCLKRSKGKGKPYWYPKDGPAIGWKARLDAYDWNGAKWDKTKIELKTFSEELIKLEKRSEQSKNAKDKKALEECAKEIYLKIRKWGISAAEEKKPLGGEKILELLESLWGEGITEVNSTLTKVYALSRPNEYVIYDTRVAVAILRIAEYMYPVVLRNKKPYDTIDEFQKAFRHLGTFNGAARGGTRLGERFRSDKWPKAYTNCEAQREANKLCIYIVEVLNEQGVGKRKDWTLREVEAVLFMEGY